MRPQTLHALDPDVAARLARKAMHHAEAQSGPLPGSLVVKNGSEDLGHDLGRHAVSAVGHYDLDKVAFAGGVGRAVRHPARRNLERAAISHGIAGIDHQVHQC